MPKTATRIAHHLPRSARKDVSVCVLDDARTGNPRLARHLARLGFNVAVAATEPQDFFAAIDRRLPSIAVVDLSHSSADRLGAVAELSRSYPAMRTLAIVPSLQRDLIERCKVLGAWQCVHRASVGSAALARLIHQGAVAQAKKPSPRSRSTALRLLTPRETEVLAQISLGADNLKIAALLGMAEPTVKVHVTSLYRKLGAQNRVELALMGRGLPIAA